MDPDHDGLAPPSPSQPQRLPPQSLRVAADALDLPLLLLAPAFDVLVLARYPLVLAALVDKLQAMLLERRHGVQRELVIGGDEGRRPGHDHGRDGLVGLQELLDLLCGDGDEVGFDVLGVLDEDGGVDDGCQRLGGEVASLFQTLADCMLVYIYIYI